MNKNNSGVVELSIQIKQETMELYQELDQNQKIYVEIVQEIQLLITFIEENRQIIETLNEINNNRDNDEKVLIPLGRKMFLPVKLEKPAELLFSIGKDLKKKMSIEETIINIEKDIEQANTVLQQRDQQKQQLENAIRQIQAQIQKNSGKNNNIQ